MDYITTTDVDTLLGPDWAGAFDPARAVLMANAWLSQRIRAEVEAPMPSAILQAGAEIAREAAAGKLYQAAGREVSSTTVSAGGDPIVLMQRVQTRGGRRVPVTL